MKSLRFHLLHSDRGAILAIMVAVLIRAAWSIHAHSTAPSEAYNIAVAIANGHGFADPYRPGQGATAHLLPISPLIAGFVYSIFGISSSLSEGILAVWSIFLSVASYGLFYLAFGRLGMARSLRIVALWCLAISPSYWMYEAIWFRVWDGALAVASGALLVWLLTVLDAGRRYSLLHKVAIAANLALLFFVNPSMGVAGWIALAIFFVRRCTLTQALAQIALCGAVLLLLVGPWYARNEASLHAPVAFRDNLGLELTVGLFPKGAVSSDMFAEFNNYMRSFHPIHPHGFAKMAAAGGEVRYYAELEVAAVQWIRQHPTETITTYFWHGMETLFPQPWMFQFDGSQNSTIKSLLASLFPVLALVTVFARLAARREWQYAYVAAFLLVPIVVYLPFQPMPRYTYLTYAMSVFFACNGLGMAAAAVRRQSLSANLDPIGSLAAAG